VTAIDRTAAQPNSKIAVVYVCDANYHDLTIYSLASVARAHGAPLDFYFMQSEYQRPVPTGLLEMVTARHHSLIVANAPFLGAIAPSLGTERQYSHISATMFLKAAAIDALAGSYEYVLYLDGDTLAFGDLHCERIAGFPKIAAACFDLSIVSGFEDPGFFSNCERNGVSPDFFNSGVIMVNSKKWRETRASARFMENVFLHEMGCPYFSPCEPNDQCSFNMTLGSDLMLLPISRNVQKSVLHTRTWESALMRHYTGPAKFLPIRPWTCDRREYALVKAISRECRLPSPCQFHDFGVSYQLNKIRRHGDVSISEHAITRMTTP
jgi:lipopolysaccharide biosynthesis glycosyltransferase